MSDARRDDPGRSMRAAEALCADRGLSFTPLRREVFSLVCGQDHPVGAYELLDQLKQRRENAAPVTVYRALDFLVRAGLVHRVSALNAYTACHRCAPGHGGLLLVCGQCSHVIELEDQRLEQRISRTAADANFQTSSGPVEVRGVCEGCRSRSAG
jgi:Fur family zinc uptake transcriptional regulator